MMKMRIIIAVLLFSGCSLIAVGWLHRTGGREPERAFIVSDVSASERADDGMSRWLLREGWRCLHRGQRRRVQEIIALARFFGASEGAADLREAHILRERIRARALLHDAADAEAAGDERRAARVRQALERMMSAEE